MNFLNTSNLTLLYQKSRFSAKFYGKSYKLQMLRIFSKAAELAEKPDHLQYYMIIVFVF